MGEGSGVSQCSRGAFLNDEAYIFFDDGHLHTHEGTYRQPPYFESIHKTHKDLLHRPVEAIRRRGCASDDVACEHEATKTQKE